MTRRRTPLLTAFITASLVALTVFPGVAVAKGKVDITVDNVVNQGGLYTAATPYAGFFDVTAVDTGDSHLTHEDLKVYFASSMVPLAAFYLDGNGVQSLEPACTRPDRGGDASLPAFLCSWDEN